MLIIFLGGGWRDKKIGMVVPRAGWSFLLQEVLLNSFSLIDFISFLFPLFYFFKSFHHFSVFFSGPSLAFTIFFLHMSQKNTSSILSLQLSEILVTLKPFIHAFIVLTRILQWKPINDNNNNNNDKTNPMLFIVLLWSILCFHHKFLLGIVIPIIIITILVTGLLPKITTMATTTTTTKTRFGARRSSCSTDQNLEDEEPIMTEIIQELAELTKLLTRLFNMTHDDDSLYEKKKKKNASNNSNNNIMIVDRENIIMGTCLMIFWQWVLHTSRLCYVVWFTGCLLLTWWSPWVHMLRHMIQQKKGAILASVANIFNAATTSATTSTTTTMKKTTPFNTTETNIVVKQELDRFYCFSIYEHQRWWLHRGWSKSLLPHDRPQW